MDSRKQRFEDEKNLMMDLFITNTQLLNLRAVTFTFTHLADAFIQSDLQAIQAIHFFISVC